MGVEVKPMLFKKKIAPSCSYCARAGKIDDKTYLCKKRGMVPCGQSCRRFKYDPLKRVPPRRKPADFSKYDDVDFSL